MSEQLLVVSCQLPAKIPTIESHPPRRSRECNFKFRQWGGLWYGWCTRLGCSNRIQPKPWKPRRVSARCRGVYGLGDFIAWLLSCFGLTKQRWRDVFVLLHLAEPGRGCRACDARQRWLNELAPRFAQFMIGCLPRFFR
jgi:hypothetical protein